MTIDIAASALCLMRELSYYTFGDPLPLHRRRNHICVGHLNAAFTAAANALIPAV